jgi:hypothetical protein
VHGPASSPSPALFIPAACGICGDNMRLAYIDPTGINTVYAYRCDNGHHHEILRADKRAASVGPRLSGQAARLQHQISDKRRRTYQWRRAGQ